MTKFHVNPETGEPGQCTASVQDCRYASNGETPQHYSSEKAAREAYEAQQEASSNFLKPEVKETLIVKNGVEVVEGKIAVGDFARGFNKPEGSESHYDGTWEELQELVKTHWDNNEPGIGSVDGDVLLINVPPAGFHNPIVEITPENEQFIVEENYVRVKGEKSVKRRTLPGFEKSPADFVKIVVYRADVLARDDSRTTNGEWEIIAILAQDQENVPMDPETMKRNANHDVGGTFREYTQEEWDEAYSYWDTHVKVAPSQPKKNI